MPFRQIPTLVALLRYVKIRKKRQLFIRNYAHFFFSELVAKNVNLKNLLGKRFALLINGLTQNTARDVLGWELHINMNVIADYEG